MTTLIQANQATYNPDQQEINAPVLLKIPIVLQSQVIPKPYGCEVVVPILLKIPITLEVEVKSTPPQCNAPKPRLIAPSTAVAPAPVATNSDATPTLNAPPPGSGAIVAVAPTSERQSDLQSNQPPAVKPVSPAHSTLPSMQEPKGKEQGLNRKLQRCYPITVLTLLLGTLLGTSCSSMVVNHLLSQQAHQHCTIAQTTTPLALPDQCFE